MPASCKPTPPILIRFVDGPEPGPAVLHLEALEPVTDVVVRIWTRGSAGAGLPQQVWRGGLARGESRLLRVAPSLPEGAAELWAAAEVQHEPEAMIRSLASVPLATRGPELTSEPGRLLVSQPTGERVLEFTGSRAVAR